MFFLYKIKVWTPLKYLENPFTFKNVLKNLGIISVKRVLIHITAAPSV